MRKTILAALLFLPAIATAKTVVTQQIPGHEHKVYCTNENHVGHFQSGAISINYKGLNREDILHPSLGSIKIEIFKGQTCRTEG